jgi:hypothetical protein
LWFSARRQPVPQECVLRRCVFKYSSHKQQKTDPEITVQMSALAIVLTQKQRCLRQAEAGNHEEYLPPHSGPSLDYELVSLPEFLNPLYSSELPNASPHC